MKHNFYSSNENDKIMYIIEKLFNATSPATAVALEDVVNKGISLGMTETYPRGREDGHPWWPRTSVMSGVGSVEAVMANEEKYLHRKKMSKNGGRVKMYYWVDRTHEHEIIRRNTKSSNTGLNTPVTYAPTPTINHNVSPLPKGFEKMSMEEIFNIYDKNYPGQFMLVTVIKTNQKRMIGTAWAVSNPEKAKELYGI